MNDRDGHKGCNSIGAERKDSEKANLKDQITLDFEGFIDGKPFNNGAGKDFPLVLGSNSFIPGFEDHDFPRRELERV